MSQQNPEKKIRLSEHCRLYFGALFKAIGVLNSSLQNSQPPETFITQSKLVITVGQKLVDRLCRETQERDVRNEILRGSSCLCSLLKDRVPEYEENPYLKKKLIMRLQVKNLFKHPKAAMRYLKRKVRRAS